MLDGEDIDAVLVGVDAVDHAVVASPGACRLDEVALSGLPTCGGLAASDP